MIADKIIQYLAGGGKTVNEFVMESAVERFRWVMHRQLMQEKNETSGKLYATMVTKSCARQAAYKFHGFASEGLPPRTVINFLIGDFVEISVLALAELSGAKIERNNERLQVNAGDFSFACKPDGLIRAQDGLCYNVEIKKMNDHGYADWEKNGLDDTWGYLTQTALECKAWESAGVRVFGTCFIGVNSMTGNIREEILSCEENLAAAAVKRAIAVKLSSKESLPERAYSLIPEIIRKKPTGRMVAGLNCRYCAFVTECFPGIRTDIVSGKPVFYYSSVEEAAKLGA